MKYLLLMICVISFMVGCQSTESVSNKQINTSETQNEKIIWIEDRAIFDYKDWKFTVRRTEEKEIYITNAEYMGTNKNDLVLEIPSEVESKKVVGVGKKWEWYNRDEEFCQSIFGAWIESAHGETCSTELSEQIKKIILPEGIQSIEPNALAGCVNVIELEMPNSLESIKGEAFFGCENLSKVILGKNVADMSVSAFNNCKKLNTIEIDKDNKNYEIEDRMVVLKAERKLLMVPSGIERITIPENVIDIEEGALTCGSLREVNVSDNHKIFAKDGNCIYFKKNGELCVVETLNKDNVSNLVVSSKIKKISEKAVTIGKKKEKKRVVIGKNVRIVSGFWQNFAEEADVFEFKGSKPPKVVNLTEGYVGVPIFCTMYVPKNSFTEYEKWIEKYGRKKDVDIVLQ